MNHTSDCHKLLNTYITTKKSFKYLGSGLGKELIWMQPVSELVTLDPSYIDRVYKTNHVYSKQHQSIEIYFN